MKRGISSKDSNEPLIKKKKLVNNTLLRTFGINFNSFPVVNTKLESIGNNNYIPSLLNEDSEEGVNISFNNDFFKETFFEAHRAKWDTDKFSRMIVENTSQNEELKVPNNTKEDQDNSFFNFMERILNDELKSGYSIKILSTIDGLNGMEIFRSEAKETESYLLKDFLKVIMLSLRQCLVFMEILHDNTGYIYPIRAPSMENVGGLCRLSMTCVLPKPLMYYLQFKPGKFNIFSASSLNVQNRIETLDPSNSKVNTYSCNENASESDMSITGLLSNNESTSKANILKRFIPTFLQEADICVDSSSVFGDKFVVWTGQQIVDWNGHSARAFEVKTQKDVEVLVHNCSCMISYINKLFCFLHRELGISEENIKMEQFEELNGIEFDFNPFEYRFKDIDSNARSNIYLVERFDGKNWEPFQIITQFIGELGPLAHTLEKRFNKLVINTDPSQSILPVAISNFASECEIGISEKDLLEFLYKSCIALNELHSVNWIHGDIKPAHLLKREGKVYLIDFEFAQEVGSFLSGFTKGYHPPEYDTENFSSRVTLKGDIYSLGISVLHILFRKDKKLMSDIELETIHATSFVKDLELQNKQQDLELKSDKKENSTSFRNGLEQLEKEELMKIRNNIQSYLEKINCPILRDVLTRMTESKPKERIQNAGQIVNLLNPQFLNTTD